MMLKGLYLSFIQSFLGQVGQNWTVFSDRKDAEIFKQIIVFSKSRKRGISYGTTKIKYRLSPNDWTPNKTAFGLCLIVLCKKVWNIFAFVSLDDVANKLSKPNQCEIRS